MEVRLQDEELLRFCDRAMTAMFREWMNLGAGEGRCSVGQVRSFLDQAQVHVARLAQVAATGCTTGSRMVSEMGIEEVLRAFEGWIGEDVARGRPSPHTVRNYVSDVRQFLEWLADGTSAVRGAAEVDEGTMVRYRSYLSRPRAEGGLGLKAGTVGRKLISVRQFYKLALKRDLVRRNPVEGVKGPVEATAAHSRRKCLSTEEAKRLLRAPDVTSVMGLRDLCMLMLMMIQGLRVVEVQRLDVGSIDWGGGRVGALDVHGKRDKRRRVFLTPKTRQVLKMWEEHRHLMNQEDRALFISVANGTDHTRLSTRAIREMTDGYLEKVGAKRPGVSCHALRHTFATEATVRGARMETLSLTMGHESVTTTQVYQDMVRLQEENPAELLDGLLEGVV